MSPVLLVLDVLCSFFRDALSKKPKPQRSPSSEAGLGGSISNWYSINSRHCCTSVLALLQQHSQTCTVCGLLRFVSQKQRFAGP